MKNILIVGSINMDLVINTERVPNMGETVSGSGFMTIPGGKGANQAVAAARLGADVKMIGAVGNDVFGKVLSENLKESGVDTKAILSKETSSGIAVITICKGDNQIILDAGANGELCCDDIASFNELFKWADIVVLQLEIPWNVVMHAAKTAKENGCIVLLNPAPVENFNNEILQYTDILIPNEHEAGIICGTKSLTKEEAKVVAEDFASKGINTIITLGSEGCVYSSENGTKECEAIKTNVVDTTAAGDSFIGGFCTALCDKKNVDEAIAFATKVASVTVSRKGACSSLPYLHELSEI